MFQDLLDGHKRYLRGPLIHPHTTRDAMLGLAVAQSPEVCILACADSRVSPEIIFDLGLGDLFVVRVAGNFADEDNQASLEYAVQHFSPPPALIVVLGHERCGAIQAAAITFDPSSVAPEKVEEFGHHPAPSARLVSLVTRLQPAILASRASDHAFVASLYWRYTGQGPDEALASHCARLAAGVVSRGELEDEFRRGAGAEVGDTEFVASLYWRYLGCGPDEKLNGHPDKVAREDLENEFRAHRLDKAVCENVKLTVAELQANEVIQACGTFVVGARYDLDDGLVTWLTPTPE